MKIRMLKTFKKEKFKTKIDKKDDKKVEVKELDKDNTIEYIKGNFYDVKPFIGNTLINKGFSESCHDHNQELADNKSLKHLRSLKKPK